MKSDQFLLQLRDLSLEEGCQLVKETNLDPDEYAAFGIWLANEALEQSYTDPTISLKLAEILTCWGEHVHHLSSHALGLKAKGDALRIIGFHRAALDCLDEAGKEFLTLDDKENWARSRISLILSAGSLGRFDEAFQEAKSAREVFVRIGKLYWACKVDCNTALLYEYEDRYQDALDLYQQIITIYRTLPDKNDHTIRRSIAIAECNQGVLLAMLGQFEEAYRLQQQARESFIVLNETSCVISTEMNLADLEYTQGYYGPALSRYYHILDFMAQNNIDEPPLLALFKLWMAHCLMKLNRVQEACQLAEEAVIIQRQLDDSLQKSNALREYAKILIASGRLQDALTTLDEARILFSDSKLHYYVAITELQQAEVLLELGRFTEAYQQASLLRNYFDAQNMGVRSVHTTLVMASALAAIDGPEERQQAILLSQRVVKQAHQYNLQEEVYRGHHLLGRIYRLQGDYRKATRHYMAAIAQIERILDYLTFDLSPNFLHTTWTLYKEMIALCLQQSQFERAFSYLERARSMALRQHLHRKKAAQEHAELPVGSDGPDASTSQNPDNTAAILRLQQELNEWQGRYRQYSALLADSALLEAFPQDRNTVEQELKRCEAKLSDLFERLHLYQATVPFSARRKQKATANPYLVDITKMRQQLTPEQCLLAYFSYQEKLVVFMLTNESLVTLELPGVASQLDFRVPQLYAHLQPRGWPDVAHPPQEAIRGLLRKLYTLIAAPVVERLPSRITSLVIVPYGPLHELPFHALYDGQKYLIERFQVSYLPASSLLHRPDHAHHEPSRSSVSEDATPVIFAYAGNSQAQRILDEASMLKEMLGGTCYLEQEATSERLIASARGHLIIHIATHGHARLDAPNLSSIHLADGRFNAINAFQLDLRACELVTLSGCETGKAFIGGGDEQLGLSRAFLAAGAKSLVMSLWPVEDNVTTELMQHFYRSLLNGDTRTEALRAAQCHLLKQQSSTCTHPYFWAAFRLIGETGELSIL